METKTRITNIKPTIGGYELTLHIDGDLSRIDTLVNRDLRLKLVQWREQRSNNANRYFHVLSDQLADAMRMSKPKMKNYLLFHYGQKVRDSENNLVVIKTNADERELIERSDMHLWYIKDATDGTPMYVLLEHSRFYDTKQMSILIDGVVMECKAQGIDTMTPSEIEELKQRWGIEVGEHNSDE